MAEQLVFDYRTAALTDADRELCDYAVMLTLRPGEVGPTEVEGLRAHGFGDEAISHAVQVVAYFNYINRVADALGVDAEPWMEPSREEWDRRRAREYLG